MLLLLIAFNYPQKLSNTNKNNPHFRLNKPFDYIITIDKGDVGFPDEFFYNLDNKHEVTI